MPRSSRASLSDETIQELENQFYAFLDSLTPDERKKFFAEFLTNEEKMMMYKRLALYWCLLEGYSLAKIQQMIGVTHDTTRVYNKRKNTLSQEFKDLVAKIGRSEMSAIENAPKMEEKEETPIQTQEAEHLEEKKDEGVNIDLDAPIETRPLDEPMEEVRMEMPNMPVIEEQETHEEEKKMDDMDEKMEEMVSEEKRGEDGGSLMPEDKPAQETEQREEGMESKEAENNEENNEETGEKKKSGIAKFFGF